MNDDVEKDKDIMREETLPPFQKGEREGRGKVY